MNFKEWHMKNNHDGLNAVAAWNAAIEEAAKALDAEIEESEDRESRMWNSSIRACQSRIRALKHV